jgi:hypothetical protein
MIRDWILEASGTIGVNLKTLCVEDVHHFVGRVRQAFCDSKVSGPIWTGLRYPGKRRTDGWRDISNFVKDVHCLLYVEDGETEIVFEIPSGDVLERLLIECPGFEFCVFDSNASFVLCHNSHDCLVGAGTSVAFVESLPEQF